ncbi:hypothetical protein KR51_00006010 [Rubidibacter lacunae KORDI 51-2]|uniref:Uncharacterized protein n=1 Tax=Rubidibacter lacunae KORDI 51-2 TaxID=582515 RepID=U5DE20_9CHRO|nr:hypothetical protein [Rubidibacter lacunae]ERN42753.1 hypothetical protein KR51_00006010 [Rubidibacter lacunae KORDI 51-2]
MLNKSKLRKSGKAYGLTALIPIKSNKKTENLGQSYASNARQILQQWPSNEYSMDVDDLSPMAKVPNTYLCRFYILNDIFYEGKPAIEEHLKSSYIVFSGNFYSKFWKFPEALEDYVRGMWKYAGEELTKLLQNCVGFECVNREEAADKKENAFVGYIKRCQVDNALFFNGSTDDSLKEQLKALYLRQAFTHFVFKYQTQIQTGKIDAVGLQKAFRNFVEVTRPHEVDSPFWPAGIGIEPEGISDL